MPITDPQELFVAPVAGSDDLFAFRFDFALEGKALDDGSQQDVVTELENGDLLVEGYAAVFEGTDREGENFVDDAFQEGIKAFLKGQSAFCYHHRHADVLGRVLELQEEEGKGLKMKARVDGAIKNHPTLGTIYHQIKNGTITGLSVGGFFKRVMTAAGQRISKCDLTEISATAVPVHPGTSFSVVAGKALASDLNAEHVTVPTLPESEIRGEDFERLQWALMEIDMVFDRLKKRAEGDSSTTTTSIPEA